MLWTLVVILLVLWALGLAFKVASGLIHILLVIALVVIVFRLISGRRVVWVAVRVRGSVIRIPDRGPRPATVYGTIHSRVRSSGTSMRGCHAVARAAPDIEIVLAGPHHEERVGRGRQRRRRGLVVIAGGVQRHVRLGPRARRAADLERAVAALEVDDLEVMAVLVGIWHHDQPLRPADVGEPAGLLPDGLRVVDARRNRDRRPRARVDLADRLIALRRRGGR